MNSVFLSLLLCSLYVCVISKPAAIQIIDETSLPQFDSTESDNIYKGVSEDFVMRKPNKMADKKHKRVDGSPIEKVESFRDPMDIAPAVDLFQQLMVPFGNEDSEMERLFKMKYEKMGESPRGEGPK